MMQQSTLPIIVTLLCWYILYKNVYAFTITPSNVATSRPILFHEQWCSRYMSSTTSNAFAKQSFRLQSSVSSTYSPSSAASAFDTYTPGVTNEIVWKDDATQTSTNVNQYTAKDQDVCVVSYVGTIMSTGRTFTKSDDFAFQIGSGKSLPGFDFGCIGMSDGTTRTLRVPPNKAYGAQGTFDGKIPPNADLEFTITMKRLVSNTDSPILAQLALFGELRLVGLIGCVSVLALPPLFQ
jgi:FKBP-type peptidyl-prolyl cis-trans isomerase